MGEKWHYVDGKRVEGPCHERRPTHRIGMRDRETGYSPQLPKYYKFAKRFREDGRVCWNSHQEARDMCKRAADAGEDIAWDESGGLMED